MKIARPFLLSETYFPEHDENRMCGEGDTAAARDRFLCDRFPNLDFLLHQRYSWMNDYINEGDAVIEIGCGAGFSPLYLKIKPILTDAVKNHWVDEYIDATNMNLADESVDVLIASQTIHHFYSPFRFFIEALRVLRPGGLILIQEINTSLLMRGILRLMRHEGYSYDINIFEKNATANDARDPWSANCAIPQLLFKDEQKFNAAFFTKNSRLTIMRNELCECFIFPLSGGVIAKTKVPRLPLFFLKMVSLIDKVAIKAWPDIFALGRRVVVQKTNKTAMTY